MNSLRDNTPKRVLLKSVKTTLQFRPICLSVNPSWRVKQENPASSALDAVGLDWYSRRGITSTSL